MRLTIHKERAHLWTEAPDRPGCYATGKDLPELLEVTAEAIRLYDTAILRALAAQRPGFATYPEMIASTPARPPLMAAAGPGGADAGEDTSQADLDALSGPEMPVAGERPAHVDDDLEVAVDKPDDEPRRYGRALATLAAIVALVVLLAIAL